VRGLALVPAAAAGAWSLPALAPLMPSLCRGLAIARTVNGAQAGVALTFDDGPHPQGTPVVLELLARASVPAAFFLVGEQVARRPRLAAEIAAAGHTVALHGHRHRNHLRVSPRAIEADLERGFATVAEATGREPALYRPPYGIFSLSSLMRVRRRGLEPLLWSRWGRDWSRRATAASITGTATEGIEPGDVVLLHDADFYSAPDSWRRTAEALPRILDALASRGLHPVAP
jgi:peptidoglycan-N-acetylglucosamine deacetylase